MNLHEMMKLYREDGLSMELAAARVCQDIILKAIAEGSLSRNVTIKGGVVMRNLTNDNRRATRDIDLDFIHYSLEDESIRAFVSKLNCIQGCKIEIVGNITVLKHQDYHGKSIVVRITDEEGTHIDSKIDIGVHKHSKIEQGEYCFDVCLDDKGANLLANLPSQMFTEKLRAMLVFGVNNGRYRDVYDLFFLKDKADLQHLKKCIKELIFDDPKMREKSMDDVIKRVELTLKDKTYQEHVSKSRQRWLDDSVEDIANGLIAFLKLLANSIERE